MALNLHQNYSRNDSIQDKYSLNHMTHMPNSSNMDYCLYIQAKIHYKLDGILLNMNIYRVLYSTIAKNIAWI